MAEEYVSKEVFDARMDRMEALLEKTLVEIKSEVGQIRSEMKESNAQLRGEIGQLKSDMQAESGTLRGEMGQLRSDMQAESGTLRGEMEQLRTEVRSEVGQIHTEIRRLDSRIDSLQTTVYWGFALMGLFVAMLGFFITFAPSIWGMLRKRNRSAVSRREVENIVNASFDRYLGQSLGIQGK